MADEIEESRRLEIEERRPDKIDEDIRELRSLLGDGILNVGIHRGQISVKIAPSSLVEASEFLRNSRGFRQLTFLAGVDCLELPVPYRFKVTYSLLDFERAKRIRLEVPCADDLAPCLPSVSGVWPGASFHESEAYDLMGIEFEGNENLERILTPDGFEGYPHRKDFDISAEPVVFSFREAPAGKPEAAE